jgi:hypothetical protein
MTTDTHEEGESTEIVVEINKNTRKEIRFHGHVVTGRDIKNSAGVPLDDDLARRCDDKLELVTNDEPVTIRNHECFIDLPPGTIS